MDFCEGVKGKVRQARRRRRPSQARRCFAGGNLLYGHELSDLPEGPTLVSVVQPDEQQIVALGPWIPWIFGDSEDWIVGYLEGAPNLGCSSVWVDEMARGACLISDRNELESVVATIMVLPQYRGQGIGRALLMHSLRRLRDQGRGRVLAHIRRSNTASRETFLKCGFQRLSATDDGGLLGRVP